MENTFYALDVAEWHTWLQANHKLAKEVWLIYYKSSTSQPTISYEDSINEALCFGWVDSRIKRIDEQRYTRLFTPRLKSSRWSESNKQRVRELIKEGRMTPAGMESVTFSLEERQDS